MDELHNPPGSTPNPVNSNPELPNTDTHNVPIIPVEPEKQPQNSETETSGWHDILSTIGLLFMAFILAILMIMFIFRSYQVDGPSMQNTLHNNDKLIIWKVPRTWARITGHQYVPNRGDIIVFTESGLSQFGQEDTKQLIKRVIGLPGDRVVVKNGQVTIYDKQYPNGYYPDQSMPYGKNIPTTSGDIDVTLGPNQLFVCGDNRPDSLDSRSFGPINTSQIIGKLVLRVFPVNQTEVF